MAPSWEECKQFEGFTSTAWRETLYSQIDFDHKQEVILIEDYEGNYDVQKDHWDKLIIFRGSESPKRIELKTVRQEKYYKYFLDTQKILIETIGNVEKYRETGDLGSSIFNSNADYWGYGFYIPSIDQDIIIDPLIFYRKELAYYLKPRVQNYFTLRTDTNKLYNTEFIFVPLHEIERFIVNK